VQDNFSEYSDQFFFKEPIYYECMTKGEWRFGAALSTDELDDYSMSLLDLGSASDALIAPLFNAFLFRYENLIVGFDNGIFQAFPTVLSTN
jgi:hypothetical protein